tara:strand:+ start:2472 stop:3437 length:966 start_codon:yes stop_codon:yes gene_type:complete
MKKLLLVLLISLFFSFSVYSQCSDSIKVPYSDGSYGKYVGCLDDFGAPSGKGLLKTDIYQKDGEWKSGKLDGKGKFTFLKDNSVYEGIWKEDKLIKGTYILKNQKIQVKYEGDFEDLKFQGFGVLKVTNSDSSTKKEGEFINDDLFEGKSLVVWNDGLVVSSNIYRGKVIDEKRNDINYYNTNDVIGDQEFSIISLKKEGSENEGISYIVEMEINGVKGEWVFDTGAELFSIGQRMFKRLVNQGVEYRDLNRTIKTFGIGGESLGRLIILDNIKIGDYIINNVIVKIANNNNYSLMGMAFLNKFKDVEWSMKKNQLKIYKY